MPNDLSFEPRDQEVELGRLRARLVSDERGILRDANIDACVMMDLGRRVLIGKRLGAFIDRSHAPKLEQLLESVSSGRPGATNLSMRNRVGRPYPARIEGAMRGAGELLWTIRLCPA